MPVQEAVNRGLSAVLLLVALLTTPGEPAAESVDTPRVSEVGMVAPDIMVITIADGFVRYGEQLPYEQRPEDIIESPKPGDMPHRWVKRKGQVIGALVGREGKLLQTFDTLAGGDLDMSWAARPQSFVVSSSVDPSYRGGVHPVKVFRKSYPTDIARLDSYWTVAAAKEHKLYLRLPEPLQPGNRYQISFDKSGLADTTMDFDPTTSRSEAVHVSQLGFRPDDPAKMAFLSTWMGTGGALDYDKGAVFELIDIHTREVAHRGEVKLSKAADDETEDAYERNYNRTDVYVLDFSRYSTPGTYRVCVQRIGCSYSFDIAEDVWTKAFVVAARGLYHQRSGIALGPPYTTYHRPRAFHPDDGVTVFQSTTPLIETGNGYDEGATTVFELLRETTTEQRLDDAWGGYMDAGDWDRRVQHLVATRYLLDLAELFPEAFENLSLDIPESGNDLPDIVDEALFNLDFYRRLQAADGGVRGGIESFEHPRYGEASWQESLTVAAFAPDVWSSYVYAATAAQAANYLRSRKPELADAYRSSALEAMEWAEARFPEGDYPRIVADTRNLAAAELYRLNGEPGWHELFLTTTVFESSGASLAQWKKHDQGEAAWVYARATHASVDRKVQENAINALLREADSRVEQSGKTGFRWTKFPYFPPFMFPIPMGVELLRAHRLSGREGYLTALVLSTQFGAGANPLNLVYTTGLGHKSPQHPLQVDHRLSHQPAPPGLTLFGPIPHAFGAFDQSFDHVIKPYAVPNKYKDWPGVESFWDVHWFVAMNEYTIHQSMAPTLYVWGYLAARAALR